MATVQRPEVNVDVSLTDEAVKQIRGFMEAESVPHWSVPDLTGCPIPKPAFLDHLA